MAWQRTLAPGIFLLAAFGAFHLHERLEGLSRVELGETFVPRPEVAKLSSFGFHTALSDYYWLQAVQIVGAAVRPESQGTLLGRFIDVVTTVDPWVGHPYRFAAVWLTGSEADVRQANRLLERSFHYHPREWRNRFYLGFNLFYYLEENEEASYWIEEAAKLEGAPGYLTGLAARLRSGHAGLEAAASMISQMRDSSEDPYRRARFEQMLDEIETERRARLLDAARDRFRRAEGRDIERVSDLLRSPVTGLRELPPEPHGWEWVVSEQDGQIVSSYYGHRYRPHHDREAARYGWEERGGESGQGETR